MPFALTILAVLGLSAGPDADGGRAGLPTCRTTYRAYTTFIAESERGDRMMAIGQYDLAADAYRTAQRASCGAAKVFLYGRLAEAECRAGRIKVGQSLLADYACILAVVVGERGCGSSGGDQEEARPLTERCKETMCGDAPSRLQEPAPEAQIEGLLQSAAAARLACGEAW